MCGICGFTGQNVDRGQVLTDMMNRIIHRGPDGAGQYMDDEIAMGFRRLSIIDLEGGDQPMRTEGWSSLLTGKFITIVNCGRSSRAEDTASGPGRIRRSCCTGTVSTV